MFLGFISSTSLIEGRSREASIERSEVRRLRASFASLHPGGAGAPPGTITSPCQELADAMRSFRRMEAKRGPAPEGERRWTVRREAAVSQQLVCADCVNLSARGAAFRNGPACRRAVRPSPPLRDARCIVRTIRRGCLRFESVALRVAPQDDGDRALRSSLSKSTHSKTAPLARGRPGFPGSVVAGC